MFADLITALRDLHPPDWRLATLVDEAGRRGWPSGGDGQRPGAWLEVAGVRGSLRESDNDQARAQGVEVEALTFTVPDGQVAEAVELLGRPPSVVDGPAMRWYAPTARLEIVPAAGGCTVHVEPMPWSEDEENRFFEWGELDSAPYRFRLDDDALLPDGFYLSGGLETEDLDAALDELPPLLADLQDAVQLVPQFAGEPTWTIARADDPGTFVRGVVALDACRWEHWSGGEQLGGDGRAATPDGVREVAAAARAVIGSWDVESADELTLQAFSAGTGYRLRVLGLGLPG